MLKKLTALLLTYLSSQWLFANENPLFLFKRMTETFQQQNYEIAFIHNTDRKSTTLRYSQAIHNQQPYAQLLYLEGPRQEVLQRDNMISYFNHRYQPVSIKGKHIVDEMPAIPYISLTTLNQYYDILYAGKDRIADRVSHILRILPKDNFRYQYMIWLDAANSMLLRADILDNNGNILDQFKVINYTISDDVLRIVAPLDNLVLPPLLQMDTQTIKPLSWQASWLPHGFKLLHANTVKEDNVLIDNQFYSDGLFSFSLYVSNQVGWIGENNFWREGMTTLYTENRDGKSITLIGQIPLATARRIVQDIVFSN